MNDLLGELFGDVGDINSIMARLQTPAVVIGGGGQQGGGSAGGSRGFAPNSFIGGGTAPVGGGRGFSINIPDLDNFLGLDESFMSGGGGLQQPFRGVQGGINFQNLLPASPGYGIPGVGAWQAGAGQQQQLGAGMFGL